MAAKKSKRTDNRPMRKPISPAGSEKPTGKPSELEAQIRARSSNTVTSPEEPGLPQAPKTLARNLDDAVLGGVCAGIERYTGCPGALWRIAFIALTSFFGLGLLAYIALWLGLPKQSPAIGAEASGAPRRAGLYRRVDWISCAVTTIIVMIGYYFTIAPDLTLEDSGELAVGSMYAGVPHPPGYPVWTLYTWLFTVLVPFYNIAWRVALSSAVAGAFSCGFIALMVSRGSSMLLEGIEIFKGIDRKLEERLCGVAGYVAGMLMAFNGFFWSQAVIVEVYTLSVLSVVGVLVFLLRWVYEPSRLRYLYWAFFIFGICFTNHQTLIVAAVGIEILIALRDKKLGRDLFLVNSVIFVLILFVNAKSPISTLNNDILANIFYLIGVGSMLAFGYLAIQTMKTSRAWLNFVRDILFLVSVGFVGVFILLSAGVLSAGSHPAATISTLMRGFIYFSGFAATCGFVFLSLSLDGKLLWSKRNLPFKIALLTGSAIYLLSLMFSSKTGAFLEASVPGFVAHHLIGGIFLLLTFCFIWKAKRFGSHIFPVGTCGVVWALGVSFYLYMPVSSMTNPPMNWGYPRTVQGFKHALTRGQYESANPQSDAKKFVKQVARYGEGAMEEFNLIYLLIGLTPFFFIHLMRKRERAWIVGLAAIYFFLAIILLIILNPQPDRQSATLNRVFFTSSHVMVSMSIGYGLALIGGLAIRHYEAICWPARIFAGFAVLTSIAVTLVLDKSLFPIKQYANLYGLFLSLVAFGLFAGISKRFPLSALLGIYLVMPIHPILTHWWDNEERGHLFGYWFGHDMFTPPFKDKEDKPLYPEMARNAILFGGTDPGRFNPTYMIFCESFTPPEKKRDPDFDRRDVYLITQNALADGTYLQYIRAHYNRSKEPDVPFFQELVRPPSERAAIPATHTNLLSKMVKPLDNYFMDLGKRIEDERRARGVYPPKEINTPSHFDNQVSFEAYMRDASRRMTLGQLLPGENVSTQGDRLSVSGQVAVMAINALLTRVIFDKNKDHEFYIEESFPLDWMFPHLTPFGIIMKINREPVEEMTEEIVARDHEFWKQYSKRLIGDWIDYDTPVADIVDFSRKVYIDGNLSDYKGDMNFVRDENGQKAFSKLRTAQANLYFWRVQEATKPNPTVKISPVEQQRMIREADFAFKQAVAFCPYSPEAVFKYIHLLTSLSVGDPSRLDDAIGIAEVCSDMDPASENIAGMVRQLKEMKKRSNGGLTAAAAAQPAATTPAPAVTPTPVQHVPTPFGMVPDTTLKQLTGALPVYEAQQRTNTNNVNLNFSLATAYFQTGQTNKALNQMDRILANPTANAQTLRTLATGYQSLGQIGKLETTVARLVMVDPLNPESNYDLAVIRTAVGQNLAQQNQATAAQQRFKMAIVTLIKAVKLSDNRRATNINAADLRALALKDTRIQVLHTTPLFQKEIGIPASVKQ